MMEIYTTGNVFLQELSAIIDVYEHFFVQKQVYNRGYGFWKAFSRVKKFLRSCGILEEGVSSTLAEKEIVRWQL
jgi:hypothetical protein